MQLRCYAPIEPSFPYPACSLALSTTACDNRTMEVRDCVDAQGHIVPDSNCKQRSGGGGYHFLYGGASGGRNGDTVVGGRSEPEAGAKVVSEGEVARGGFGHGGGGGEGESYSGTLFSRARTGKSA